MLQNNDKNKITNYSSLILVWVGLLALAALAVSALSFNLGDYTVFIALVVAFIKVSVILHVFMKISYKERIFKMFMMISSLILIAVFVIASADLI